jgi:hypothetical protein
LGPAILSPATYHPQNPRSDVSPVLISISNTCI